MKRGKRKGRTQEELVCKNNWHELPEERKMELRRLWADLELKLAWDYISWCLEEHGEYLVSKLPLSAEESKNQELWELFGMSKLELTWKMTLTYMEENKEDIVSKLLFPTKERETLEPCGLDSMSEDERHRHKEHQD